MNPSDTFQRKKLIEVALPLEAINQASAREKSIRHGHPSTLHLWWARRPLAAARAVIFASLVDDPDDPNALPAFVEACRKLPKGKNVDANGDTPRMRLFDFIERLVTWEATADEPLLNTARELIQIATEGNPPPLLDPFAGGGSIPLEAQRLGLEAHASDLNPVAVMINKAQIEIPPRFANMPPVNPRDRAGMFAPTPGSSPMKREGNQDVEKWEISPELERRMQEIARKLRKNPTPSEDVLWQAIRKRQLDGRKFRRQVAIGAFVVDFYCSSERLAVEVDGPIHDAQREADRMRQELIESLGIRFVRLTNAEIEADLNAALAKIRAAFYPHPKSLPHKGGGTLSSLPSEVGEGPGIGASEMGEGSGMGASELGEGPGMGASPSLPVGEGAGGWGDTTWRGAAGLAADVRYYGEWMRQKAWERIGHLYPQYPHPKSLPHKEGGTSSSLPSEVGEGPGMGASVLGERPGMRASLSLPVGERAGDRGGRTSTGWETMLASLIDSGFSIVGTWPMRTERSVRSNSMGTNALASSIVLVCRPRPEEAPTASRRAFLDALRRELPAALQAMQSGNIAPVDLAQASIGPGMAIYSRYRMVLEADGSPMSVRTALGLINAALDEYLAEQDGEVDADTRFAVAWFEQFGFNEGEFGVADVLARAKNTSVAGVEAAGLVASGRGRVRLLHWKEYDPGAWDPQRDKRPTVWEATHHLIERLNQHGETGCAMLMTRMPHDMAAEARNLAYRLYSICERKGWAEHARDYNALVISWSAISEEAVRLRDAAQRGDATIQPRLFDNV